MLFYIKEAPTYTQFCGRSLPQQSSFSFVKIIFLKLKWWHKDFRVKESRALAYVEQNLKDYCKHGQVIYNFKYLSVKWERHSERQMYRVRRAAVIAYDFDGRPQS